MTAFSLSISINIPVTNRQFARIHEEHPDISPEDTVNFLKHWVNGKIPSGLENHPVVYISLEDAEAYANGQENGFPRKRNGNMPPRAVKA